MSTNAFKPAAKPTKPSLEELHSPDTETFPGRPHERESIAESEFNDIALDDEPPLSPVALISQRSSGSGERPRSVSVPQAIDTPKKPSHTKTASATTIRSANNLPFILARLDLQDDLGAGHRGSVDGQQRLQEEFARLQREEEVAKENAKASAIDWGKLYKL